MSWPSWGTKGETPGASLSTADTEKVSHQLIASRRRDLAQRGTVLVTRYGEREEYLLYWGSLAEGCGTPKRETGISD